MFETIANFIRPFAPAIATALGGPAAGAALTFLSKAITGKSESNPQVVLDALQKMPDLQLKLVELENRYNIEVLQFLTSVDTAQIKLNADEAKSENLFVSGWRPAIGWIFALALLTNLVIVPYQAIIGHPIKSIELDEYMVLLFGMLGMAGYRTVEKIKRRN
jgi:hypothetical protein